MRAPASLATALREKIPPAGKPPNRPLATLATPWLTNSRSASHRDRVCWAYVRAIAAGSAKPTSAMTIAGTARVGSSPQGSASTGTGSDPGIAPTTWPSKSIAVAVTSPIPTAASTDGNSRWRRRPPSTTAMVRPAIAIVVGSHRVTSTTAGRVRTGPRPAASTPSMSGSWLIAMTSAAAGVNPASTGCDIR